MTTAIGSTTSTSNTTNNANNTSNTTGIGSLTSTDFLNLMLTQLEQQDPLNPTDSNAMLSQISQISTLQSNTQMQTSLQGLTLQQSIGAGGNLMGKNISAFDNVSNSTVSGNVTSVQVKDSTVYLGIDTDANPIPMSNVLSIQQPVVNPTLANGTLANTTVGNSTLGNFVSALSGIL